MRDEFQWPEPQDQSDKRLIYDIREHECHVVGITASEHAPRYAFSVGLYLTFNHPEIIVFGLDHQTAATAINDVRDLIRGGKKFHAGERSPEIFEGATIEFVDVDEKLYERYLGTAAWFYRSVQFFPVLQLVWPDKNGNFPWDAAFDRRFADVQPLLGKRHVTNK